MRVSGCVALFAAVVAMGAALGPAEVAQATEDAKPSEQGTCTCPRDEEAPRREARPKFADLKTTLDESDEIAALEAVRVALTEIGDGTTFVWRRQNGRISGVIRPTSSFKDASGRVCRHILVVLSAGARSGKIEGIACRANDGNWELDG